MRNAAVVYTYLAIQLKFLAVTFFGCGIAFYWPAIVHTTILLLPLLSIAYLLSGRKYAWYLLVINILMTTMVFVDWVYSLAFNGSFPSLMSLKQTSEISGWLPSVWPMLKPSMALPFIDIVIIVLFLICTRNRAKYALSKWGFACVWIVIVAFVSLAYFSYKDKYYNFSDYQPGVYSTYKMKVLGVIGYPISEVIATYMKNADKPLSAAELAKIAEYHKWNDEQLPNNKYYGMFKGKNLIVMQVESLENFQFFQAVDNQVITPNLNALAKKYWYFSEFRGHEYNSSTADGELAANTSCFPFADTAFMVYPQNKYNAFPRIFEKLGYHTYSTHGDNSTTWNWPDGERGMGYDKIEYSRDFNGIDLKRAMGAIPDALFLPQVLDRIKQNKQPYENYIETGFSHAPFELYDSERQLKLPSGLDKTIMGDYLQMFRYVDTALGKFVDMLESTGVLKNTVLVMYGDHPSVHKFYDVSNINYPGTWWRDDGHRVAFMIITDGIQPMEVKTYGGQVDILPTVCYLFGVDKTLYQSSVFGRNLLNTKRNFTITPCDNKMYGVYTSEDKRMMELGIEAAALSLRGAVWGKWSMNEEK